MRKPSKQTVLQFIKFNIGGAAFFVVGYAVFALLYGVFSVGWLPAKIIGDFSGWVANYLIQRYWAFAHPDLDKKGSSVKRKFVFISIINLGIDYGIVAGLKYLGVTPFIGMLIASNFFTAWKWIWYKFWVFKVKPKDV